MPIIAYSVNCPTQTEAIVVAEPPRAGALLEAPVGGGVGEPVSSRDVIEPLADMYLQNGSPEIVLDASTRIRLMIPYPVFFLLPSTDRRRVASRLASLLRLGMAAGRSLRNEIGRQSDRTRERDEDEPLDVPPVTLLILAAQAPNQEAQ